MDIDKLRRDIEVLQKNGKLGQISSLKYKYNQDSNSDTSYKEWSGVFDYGTMPKRYAKYSDKINPFLSQQEKEVEADRLQGRGEAWWNAAKGFAANAAAGFLDALGATMSPDKISNMLLGNTEKDFTNSLSRTANSIREWSNENIPIYNGSESMWTSAYWANQISQLGTTAGIIGEGFVEQGVLSLITGGFGNVVGAGATAAKVAKLLSRVKALNTANKVNRASNYAFGMYQGVKEAYINGLENFNNVYQDYLQKGYSDEEARRVASEAASRSFRYEIGPVMFLNALQWGSIGSRYNPYSRKAVGTGVSDFTESVFTKLASKTASKGVKKATDWAGNILSEGVEEGFQTAVQGISQYQADKERNLTKGTPLSDYIFTKEFRDSVIGGIIGGGMFKALGSVRRGIIDGKDRKADERFIETFIDTTAERTKENLKKLDTAVKSGDTKAAEAIKKQMSFDSIEAALQLDYIKNDEKMTAYNAQVDQLKEISRIIKEGDIRGLELLELRNEKDENGENTFAYLRDNIDRMISDAELQKENHIKNLQLQMDLTGVENYDLAERTTRLQMMQNENNRTLEKRKESLDSLFNIERNATNNEDILEYKKLQSFVTAYNSTTTKFSNPEIQKEVTEAKERIETLERDNPSFIFDEEEYGNKQLIGVQSDILKIREANFEINKDIKQLTTNQGINEYKKNQVRQSILDYDQINDTVQLNNIKETLQKNEEINKYFSKKEIEKINKGIDNRISKLQSIEKAQAAEKLRKNNEVIKTKTKPIITPEGKPNTEVVTDEETQKEIQTNIDRIDEIRNNTSVGIVEDARSLIENSKDIPEDSFVLFQEQEENIFFEAPREFNDRNSIVRGNMKKGATNFLKRNKDATLKDYITAFINTPGVEVGDVEALYYYIADGYYEAKDQRYSDNREEVEEVYRDIFEPFNALQLIQDNINLVPETKPTPSEQVEIEKKIDTTIVEKQIEKAQPVKVDKNGRNIYYIGPKIAVPAIKVPFPGNPYNVVYNKTKSGSTEVLFIRDKEAETKEVLSGAAGLEATKRAFMMNPFLAKAGVPIQVYIPPLQELLDDSKGFIVSTWTRKGKDGPLEKGTESFSTWYNREKERFEKENPGKEFIGSDRFLEKVPIFSYVEINGERVQIGSAIHETAWWNEVNVADFRNSEDLRAALNSLNEEEREIASLTAKSRQQAVIDEGREQTLEVRRTIWNNTNKEDWYDGRSTLVRMKIREVTDGFSLKIDPKEPKRKIREANNDLRLGIILVDSNKSISVAYDSKNGKERYIPQKYIYNPSVLSGDYVGYAVSLIPYAIHEDGKPMYLVQLVDTGYTNAQETLKYLYDARGKIRQLNQDYQTARARNNISEMQKLEKQLKDIMTVAGFSEEKINTYFKLEDKDARYKILRDNLLRFYPKETEQGNLKTSFEKDNISGDIANIVVFDEQGNPQVYRPNPESQESSYVQMLKETIYTQNDYIEIRDLRKEDPNATIKVANAQPRVHLVFDEEITTEKLEFKIKGLEKGQQKKADIERRRQEELPNELMFDNISLTKVIDDGGVVFYQISEGLEGEGFSLEKNNGGYIIYGVHIPEHLRRKSIATRFYQYLNKISILNTGQPLKSSPMLTKDGEKLWESFVKKGLAEKIGNKYKFKYDAELESLNNQTTSTSNVEAKKADIEIGKVGNTDYEVKVDGVYYKGKKLDNPENKTHKEIIAEDIERRRPIFYIENVKDKKSSLETFRNEAKREWNGVPIITGDRMLNLYIGIKLFVKDYPKYKELLDKFIKNDKGHVGITNNNLSFVINTLKKEGINTESDIGAKINAKYDAELASLEGKPTKDTEAKKAEEKKEENLVATSEEIIQDSPKFELTPERKYTIVNHLFNKILQSFKEDKTSRKNIAIETRRAIETHLSDLKETNPDLYNGILENKDEILGLGEYRDKSLTVREALLNHFNMETLEEMDDVDLDTESYIEKNYTKLAQEYDVKTSLSSKLKRVFSGIPVNDKNRRGEYIEGITEYMELDDIFSALQDLLSDAPNDFTVLKERVRERIKLNPEEFEFLSYIQDILENLDPQLQHEVLFRLNQTKNRMYFIYSKENKGNYVLQVLDANSRHPFIFTKNTILEQFKNSDIVENLGNGEYSLNKEKAQEFINIANLISKSSNIGYETIRNFFATVGIYVEESTLEAMDKNDPGAFRNIVKNLTEQLKKNVIALKDYTKPLNFDEKAENVVLRENNNYLNNFIGEIIKFTFNVDQSMYVGGKIINSFSQPNFFTEQLRKISSLKGSDLSQNSKHLINKLLNNGYTKNNLLVKLITQVDEEFEELLKESKEILEELSVGYTSLEVLKRKGFRSKDQQITELSPSDYDTALIGYFGNMDKKLSATEKGIPLRMSYMTSPTLSDSSQMFLMKTVVLDLNRSHFKISNGNIDSYNDTVAEILYEQLVLPELTRMIEVKGTERDTVENQLFYGVPALNSITTADGKNILYYIRENDFDTEEMLSKIKENFGEAINNIIRNVVKNEVEEKLKIDSDGNFSGNWVKNGFIYKEKDEVKVEVLDTKYLDSKNPDGTPLSKVETAAWEYAINYLITQAQMQALFAGDPANYSKAKSSFFENKDVAVPKTENNTAEEKLKVYIGIAEETSINLSKRLKALISPGNRIAYSASKQYIQLMLQDSSSISDAYKEYLKVWYGNIPSDDMSMVDRAIELSEKKRDFEGKLNPTEVEKKEYLADLIELSDIKKDLSKKYPEISGYLENVATDAQEYTTWKEHLEVAYNMGKISEEEYNNLNRKLTEQSKGNIEGNRLSSEEKFIFQPMKPLHSGMYFRGMNNGKTYQEFVYVKTSSFPLIPEMTKGLKIDNLRKNMERLEETKGLTVRAAYESGIKVGKTKTLANTNQLLDNDNVIISDSFSILDRENFSIQQEKPFKTDKHLANNERDEIGRGTQMEKILLSNGINKISRKIFPNIFGKELLSRLNITPENDKISGEDLYKIYTDLSITEQNLKKDFFLKSLDVNENDYQIGSVSSMEKLQAALNKRLTNRQDKEILELRYFVKDEEGNGKYYTKDEIEAFNLKPVSAEFTFPIWLSPNSRKFESVLNSMITNEFIKLKFPGNSSPVASAEGFVSVKTIEELSQEDVNGIVFTDNYNGKELLPERVEDGIVKPAQVLVASKFRVKRKVNGEYIEEIIDFNTPEYINPETKRIDNSKLPPEVRQLFSFRIPSSAHQSGSLVEIVGFLPHHMGDLMIVPKEHTTKIGEDYDIDVRYSYSGNYVVNEDGSIRFLSEKDVPVYPKEELDRIYNEYRDYKISLIEYIKKNRPNSPNKENEIRSEIATTQFLINILEAKGIDENSEEIEALNLELNTLIGSLNENKEEITPERRKEIQNEIKNLHDKFLEEKKYKIEEYLNARKFFGTKLAYIENELINLYKSVYSSTDSEIQRLITTTINTDMAQETAKMIDTKIRSSQKKDNFTIYGYEHQKSTLRLGASGKLGIGVHSNWVVWNGLVQQSEKEIALIDDGEPFSMRIGNFVSDGKLGNIYALRPNLENVSEDYRKRYESFKPRRISDINMENQNSATDNQKLQIMGRRNENKYTINVFALMNNLGFDKDIVVVNGEEREILIPSLFISQPIIRRYVELKEQYSSTFADFTRDIESVITEQLRVEFANNVEFPVDPLTKELIPFLDTKTMSKVSKELTGQLLYDSLVTPYSQITQWAVYQKFIELQGHSSNVNKVIQLMNIDKGLGVSYFNIISKKNSLIDEMNSINLNISNVESLFGETPPEPIYDNEESAEKIKKLLTQNYIKIGKDENTGEIFLRKPNSPNSAKLLNSISIGYYLWGNIFPFENKYLKGQIDEIIGDRPEIESTMELRYNILSAMREYMYSSNMFNLYDGITDINQERRRLLMDEGDNESLASYLMRLKKLSATDDSLKTLFNKHFFRNLEFSINKKEPSIIKYNVNSNNSFNKNLPHSELLLMSDSLIKLPAYNGDENYTYEKLVKDLTKYAMLTNTENGAIGFRNYIPMAVFQKYNFDSQLHYLADLNTDSGKYFNMIYNGTLSTITSFLGNNVIIEDESGTYIEVPEKFLSSKEILEELIDNVNSSFGSEKKAVELDSKRGRVIINRPLSEVNKRRFIRQFYQHNPEQATKLSYKDLGINNRNLINSVSEFEYTFKEEIPNYVSIKGINGEVFLYELVETDINKSSKYRRINKLGGFGVNEYNTNSDVNISMFDSNNPKISELKPVGKKKGTIGRNAIFNLPTTPEAAITINEVMTIFENAELDRNNKEVITLSGLLADIQKFIDPNTKVYKGQLENGSPGAYNSKTNTIILDTTQFSKDRRVNSLYRVFAEEVFHSITAREVDKYIVGNNTTLEVGINSVEVKAEYLTENTPAHITKLVRLYKTAAEALIKEEAYSKNISWSQAYENIIKRYKENPTNTDAYRISNLHEFMAGIFTDGTFRRKMSKIQFKDTNTSILQQFADFVRRVLQFIDERVEGNISEQTLNTVYDFISSIHNDAASTEIKNFKTFSEMRKTDDKAKALVSDLKKPLTSSLYSKLYKSDRIKSLSPTNIVSILNKNNREVIAPEGIITATIINSERHFGNPFTPNQSTKDKNPEMVKVKDTQEATEKYMNWVLNGGLPQFENRRQWMLEQFKSGNLKGKPILVNQGSEDISYNNAIDYFINEHQWKQTQKPVEKIQTQTKSNIKFEEGNILDLSKVETQNETINIYAGTNENAELSNFAIRPFTVNVETPSGERQYTFQSVEQGFHFYKALVANNPQVAKQILATTNGGQLKRLTNRSNLKMTPEQVKEWDDTSKSIMLNLMYESYAQNPKAASKLLATGNAKITHTQDNTRWKTDFPEVVMTVRDMLREEGFGNNNTIKFEEEQSTGYKQRTIKNASADATIAIAVDFNSAGEILTKNSVLNQGKVYMPIDGNKLEVTKERVDKIVNALNSIGKDEISLNIAGNGIYTMKGKYTQEQVDKFTYDLLKAIVESSDLKVKISSIRTGGQTGFDEAGAKAGMKLGIPTTVLAPKGWKFRNIEGKDISNERLFKERFNNENQNVKEQGNEIKSTEKNEDPNRNITGKSKFNFAPREVKIRRDVNDIFEQNPELSSIGTSEQYSRYLDTIFPDSKVKDIVYHGTDKEFEIFKKPSEVGSQNRMIAFADDVEYAKIAGNRRTPLKRIISALVNINKLYPVDKLEAMELDSGYRDEVLNELKKEGVDGFAFESDDDLAIKNFNEVLVFEPEQIHILGSKEDIEGFREFVDKTIQKNQIENKKDIGKENNYVSAPREINLDFSIFTELKDDIFSNCRN